MTDAGPVDATPATQVICLGEALVEFNQQADGRYLQGHGGDTSNTAIAISRQQISSGYISRLGKDPFGDSLRALWRSEGVDYTNVIADETASTGIYFVSHNQDGHQFSYYRAHSAASQMSKDDVATDYIASATVLHVSAISQAISDSACACVDYALDVAQSNDTLISYDTNLRLNLWSLDKAQPVIERTIACADIILPGLDDANCLTGLNEADAIADRFLEMAKPSAIVALTLGSDGVLVASAQQRLRLAALPVAPVDATGAGDTFDGAFLSEWIRCGDLEVAARYANVAAALSTTGYGAVAPIPHRKQVQAILDKS